MKQVLPPASIRFTPADRTIIARLGRKLGLGTAAVVRLALRRLAQLESGARAVQP